MGPSCPLAPAPGAGSVHSPLPHATLEPRRPWFPPRSGEPPRACTAAPACCWQPPHAGGGRASTLLTPRMSKPRHRGRAGRPREWWGRNADPAGGGRDQAPPTTHDPHGAGRRAQGVLLACEKGGRGAGKMNVWSVQWPGVPPPPIAPPAKLEARTGRPIGHALRAPRAVSSATRTLRPPSRQSPHRMKAKQSSPVRGRGQSEQRERVPGWEGARQNPEGPPPA